METVTSIGTAIVSTFTTAFTDLASGISGAVVDTFDAVVLNAEGGLSNLAVWGLAFGAITFGIGIVRAFMQKVG